MSLPREPSCAVYRSVFDAAERTLSTRAAGAFYRAMLRFYFLGEEPEDLPHDASVLFEGNRHRFTRARSVAQAARGDVPEGYDPATEPQQDGYTPGNDPLANYENDHLAAETVYPPTEVPPEGLGSGLGSGLGLGSGSGQQEKARSLLPGAKRDCVSIDQLIDMVTEYAEERELYVLVNDGALPSWVYNWADNGWVDEWGEDMDLFISDPDGGSSRRWQVMLKAYSSSMEEQAGGVGW